MAKQNKKRTKAEVNETRAKKRVNLLQGIIVIERLIEQRPI